MSQNINNDIHDDTSELVNYISSISTWSEACDLDAIALIRKLLTKNIPISTIVDSLRNAGLSENGAKELVKAAQSVESGIQTSCKLADLDYPTVKEIIRQHLVNRACGGLILGGTIWLLGIYFWPSSNHVIEFGISGVVLLVLGIFGAVFQPTALLVMAGIINILVGAHFCVQLVRAMMIYNGQHVIGGIGLDPFIGVYLMLFGGFGSIMEGLYQLLHYRRYGVNLKAKGLVSDFRRKRQLLDGIFKEQSNIAEGTIRLRAMIHKNNLQCLMLACSDNVFVIADNLCDAACISKSVIANTNVVGGEMHVAADSGEVVLFLDGTLAALLKDWAVK